MATKKLKGITWGHSRGITPLLAAAQRFSELHPDVELTWDRRSLQHFADFPIEKLTSHYDLLIIDHPWVGCAAATSCVLPLDEHLPASYLLNQQQYSVGPSYESYVYGNHLWALPIDAATPVASYRADLFALHGARVPQTWSEVLALARNGKVAVPAIPIDLLMNFYMFCLAHGKAPFQNHQEVIDEATGIQALETMRELYALVDPCFFSKNPIGVAEAMTTTNSYWYCPFAYGYSNYARTGYSAHLLSYTDLVTFTSGKRLRSTVGGTGLAVSASTSHPEEALAFAQMVASPVCQSTLYVEHGGQPGHLLAWNSNMANLLTHNYFRQVLPAMERGYVRPRYNGYLHFQDAAGDPVQHFLQHGGDPGEVLTQLNSLYADSLSAATLSPVYE